MLEYALERTGGLLHIVDIVDIVPFQVPPVAAVTCQPAKSRGGESKPWRCSVHNRHRAFGEIDQLSGDRAKEMSVEPA